MYIYIYIYIQYIYIYIYIERERERERAMYTYMMGGAGRRIARREWLSAEQHVLFATELLRVGEC